MENLKKNGRIAEDKMKQVNILVNFLVEVPDDVEESDIHFF